MPALRLRPPTKIGDGKHAIRVLVITFDAVNTRRRLELDVGYELERPRQAGLGVVAHAAMKHAVPTPRQVVRIAFVLQEVVASPEQDVSPPG